MRAVQSLKNRNKKTDIPFFIYFTLMALFYTNTYIQLAAQLGILVYVAYSRITDRTGLRNTTKHSLFFLCLWFGLFTVFAKMSENWAYDIKPGSKTILTLFRIFVIGFAMFLYVTDYCKAVSVIKGFIYSNVIMAIAALVTTPISQYGKAGEEGFGTAIGQQRNTFGAVMTFVILLCILFYQYEHLKHGKLLVGFFGIALLCSGSRGAMLQLVIIIILYAISLPGMKKRVKYFSMLLFFSVLVILLLKNVPYFYEMIWVRFDNLLATITGSDVVVDASAHGRELYKVLAYEMFEEKPWLGFGVDGFVTYLNDVQYVEGFYLAPRYSHCNFTEIAACFGLAGLAIWYVPVIYIFINSFKLRKQATQMKMVFILLTSMVILDYARIPWSNHIGMYTYFCLIVYYFWIKHEMKNRKYYHSSFGTL